MADNGHKRKDKVKEKQKMGIFDRFKVLTVNDAINESRTDKNAVLIDIRAKDVYKRGYISGSINIPMTQLELIEKRVPDKEKKIYIVGSYDNEPKKAAKKLKKMGYENAIPGGICKRRLTNNLATCKVNCECPLYEKRYGTEMVNDGKERNQKTIQDAAK